MEVNYDETTWVCHVKDSWEDSWEDSGDFTSKDYEEQAKMIIDQDFPLGSKDEWIV